MTSPSAPKDKFFEKVINPYLVEVLRHPQAIEMREGVLHIQDVQGPKGKEIVDSRLEAMSRRSSRARGWWNMDSMPITS